MSSPRWFVRMPVAMLLDPALSSEAKVLAGLLLHYDDPERGCFPRVRTLMRDLAVSKQSVLRSLEGLERYGFLRRARRGRVNVYELHVVYERPFRPDSMERTGELAIENAPRPPRARRHDLDRRERVPARGPIAGAKSVPDGAPESVPDGGPIPAQSVPRRVPAYKQEPSSTKNQRPRRARARDVAAEITNALLDDAFAPEDIARWLPLLGSKYGAGEVLSAARSLRLSPGYRAGKIGNEVGFIIDVIQRARNDAEQMRAAIANALRDLTPEERDEAHRRAAGLTGKLAVVITAQQIRRERKPVSA